MWFLLGLLLALLYGLIALHVQNLGLWFCIITTVTIATFAGIGMGLSWRVRVNVALMLPMLCSVNGKKLVLFFITALVIRGPLSNTLENFERAAHSVVCGAELARNQTQQLIQRASTPLLPVLSRIQEVSRNAHSLAGRVQSLLGAVAESVLHVARTLRNSLHFLAKIGDICNAKLGSPHAKCNRRFEEAREECMEALSVFSFLCHILDGFKPLCDLARVAQVFCIIPSYIGSHLKKNLAEPTLAALEQMKREFEFNMSASVDFDLELNSSQSLVEASRGVMQEVGGVLRRVRGFTALLDYLGLFLLLHMYLKAVIYKTRYLQQDHFDNIYITARFEELDRRRGRRGGQSVLPLTPRERRTYIRPSSLALMPRERRAAVAGLVPVLRHSLLGGGLVALDLLTFWVLEAVRHGVQGPVVARAPFVIEVQVNGSGYAADIFRDIVASFDILQRGNVSILSRKCLVEPSAPDHTTYGLIGLLYGVAAFLALAGSYATRLRRLACAMCHPRRERERTLLLHQRIASQRASLGRALLRGVARSREDTGHTNILQTLTLRLPGVRGVARVLGVFTQPCLACGMQLGGEDDFNAYICSTPQCKGAFCCQCFRVMGSVCGMCKPPPGGQEDSQDELDSSEEEEPDRLWAVAWASPNV